ncbi:hypothetical protein [Massilia sp. NR 4-1]|uniref:hypothetical protein n=1 Tax=Massilia sp. NR 4-1 TaxID=1678028 RepID=UPI0006A2A7BC|nr:hypothetical protein [Massilia sp. NR 4-1]AKU24697.1 hypothetical protein ACZ75_05290 [Massilia sp. NR 4-1]
MEMKAQVTIRGAKMFRGTLDDQKQIDSGTLFVEVNLKASENAFGMLTEPMKCKDSSLVESIKHLSFPFIAELTIVMESGGNAKGMQQKVIGVKPVQAIRDGKAADSKAAA